MVDSIQPFEFVISGVEGSGSHMWKLIYSMFADEAIDMVAVMQES